MTLAKPLNTEPLLGVLYTPVQVFWWHHEMWDGYELVFGHDGALATCLSYAWEDIQDVDREEWDLSTKLGNPVSSAFQGTSAASNAWLAEYHFPLAPTGKPT